MENLAFRIEREGRYGQHITIGNYANSRRVFGYNAIWAASTGSGDFISAKTKKEYGKVIIKKENLVSVDLVILYHTGQHYAVYFYRVEDMIVYANVWPISKKKAAEIQFKREEMA